MPRKCRSLVENENNAIFLIVVGLCVELVITAGIDKFVETIESIPKVSWDFEGIHYFDSGPLTVQYLFVLDTLNFCFWPGMPFISLSFIFIGRGMLITTYE